MAIDGMDAFLHPLVFGKVLELSVDPYWNGKGAKALFSASCTDVLASDAAGLEPLSPCEVGGREDYQGGIEVNLASSFDLPKDADLRSLYLRGNLPGAAVSVHLGGCQGPRIKESRSATVAPRLYF